MPREEGRPDGYYCHGTSKQKGTPCAKRAGFGTDHVGFGLCKFHGGATQTGIAAAQMQEAQTLVATYGLPIDTDPHAQLQDELNRTAGHVAWLEALVHSLIHTGEGQSELKQYQYTEAGGTIERPAVWLELYDRERRNLRAIAKDCHDVGIEDRRIELAERDAQELAGKFRRFAMALGLDVGSDDVRSAFRLALTSGDVVEGSIAA